MFAGGLNGMRHALRLNTGTVSSAWAGVRRVKHIGVKRKERARLRERRMRRAEWREMARCMLVLKLV